MRLRNLFLTMVMAVTATVVIAQNEGFSYQAVIRDSGGELVKNKNVGLKLTLADNTGSNVMYEETQTVPTDSYGVLNVVVGEGTPTNSSNTLSDVSWGSGNVWMHLSIDVNGGTNYVNMGATKIQAVPVAFYAVKSGNTPNGGTGASEDALFEVKDKEGNVVFAVYPNGVHVYIDESDSYWDSKARRSGFLVTGRTATKDGEAGNDFFSIDVEGTHVYIDEEDDSKARRSGFIVTGRTATKDSDSNTEFFSIDGKGTQVFINDDPDNSGDDKARRSGFLVTGRTATKRDGNLFAVDANRTTGNNTAALGEYAEAKGISSTAMGIFASAPGDYSSAFGYSSEANGENSFAAGYQCKTNSAGAVALGHSSEALGEYSLALGDGAKAIGHGSCAIGISAEAGGEASFAIGQGCESGEFGSVTMGYDCHATGMWSLAFGNCSKALDHGAVALGKSATAEGSCAFATGEGSIAKGGASVAFGFLAEALGPYSVAIGPQNVSAEQEAVTLGKWLYAKSTSEMVVGSANDTTGYGVSGALWSDDDRLFTIGNGKQRNERSNAMVVLKKGSIGIGTSKPAARLEINGSIKANRIALTSDFKFMKDSSHIHNALEKVLALQGITYHWKTEDEIKALYGAKEQWTYLYAPDHDCAFTQETQAGFAADEVESVIPELVFVDANNYKSIDYEKMNAYLVEAIKEQQKQIEELKRMVEALQSK